MAKEKKIRPLTSFETIEDKGEKYVAYILNHEDGMAYVSYKDGYYIPSIAPLDYYAFECEESLSTMKAHMSGKNIVWRKVKVKKVIRYDVCDYLIIFKPKDGLGQRELENKQERDARQTKRQTAR